MIDQSYEEVYDFHSRLIYSYWVRPSMISRIIQTELLLSAEAKAHSIIVLL